jgi:hypothetical protein
MKSWKWMVSGLVAGFALSAQVLAAGAIVVNDEEGAGPADYAMVSYATSSERAAQEALQDCRSQGHRSCVVMARFQQCGALALSDKFYRVGTGSTSSQAMKNALEKCPGCRVAQVACEDANEPRLASSMR